MRGSCSGSQKVELTDLKVSVHVQDVIYNLKQDSDLGDFSPGAPMVLNPEILDYESERRRSSFKAFDPERLLPLCFQYSHYLGLRFSIDNCVDRCLESADGSARISEPV